MMGAMKIVRLLFVAVALLVGVSGVYVWSCFPQMEGELRIRGVQLPVSVHRDVADVTHIEAQSDIDALFALGFVHAQERSWQLEMNRRLARGELSAVLGSQALPVDRFIRRLGIAKAAERQWLGLPAEAQKLIEAYARGVNAFHSDAGQSLPPEFTLQGIRPAVWLPQDSLAISLVVALDLSGNWGTEFARLVALQRLTTEQLWQLMPNDSGHIPIAADLAAMYRALDVYRPERSGVRTSQPEGTMGTWLAGLGPMEGVGSNNWVVSGRRTKSGLPLLANDPHLPLTAPGTWYMARLKSPATEGRAAMDVIGATFPGMPSVVLGRTAQVAWSFTNVGSDIQDLYLEQIDTANADRYRTPTGWANFTVSRETLKVKGAHDEALTIVSTRHGPVLSDDGGPLGDVIDSSRFALTMRWSALEPDNWTLWAGMQANRAKSVDELLTAFARYDSPMQNLVAADTSGNMAYQAIGRLPRRSADNDLRGMAPALGWESRYDWNGWIEPTQMPKAARSSIEARGWLVTANQRIESLGSQAYLGEDWVTPERFHRIESLLSANAMHDLQSMRTLQGDIVSTATQKLLSVLRAARSEHPLAGQAIALMRGFDARMEANAAAPAVFAVWADELTRELIAPKIGTARFHALYGRRTFRAGLERMVLDPEASVFWCGEAGCSTAAGQALTRALDRLVVMQGPEPAKWSWGRMHEAVSEHLPLSRLPVLGRWFDVRVPVGGDPWTVNVGQYWANEPEGPFAVRVGATLRTLYDLADLERSLFIVHTGQSGLVFSSRYRDMAREWSQVEYRPLQLSPTGFTHTLTLRP